MDYGIPLPNFNISTEFLYSQKGAKQNNSTVSVDYLVFSLLGKYQLPFFRSYVFAGPYYGIIINSKLESDGTVLNLEDTQKDLGASVGIGLNVIKPLFFELKYDVGLRETDLFNTSSTGKNATLSIVAGIAI